eukprot:10271182-Karenia_brevis.AAC.1
MRKSRYPVHVIVSMYARMNEMMSSLGDRTSDLKLRTHRCGEKTATTNSAGALPHCIPYCAQGTMTQCLLIVALIFRPMD